MAEMGRPLPAIDSLLAATALEHNLVLTTRKLKADDTLLNRLVILRLMEEPGPSGQLLRKHALIKGGWGSRPGRMLQSHSRTIGSENFKTSCRTDLSRREWGTISCLYQERGRGEPHYWRFVFLASR